MNYILTLLLLLFSLPASSYESDQAMAIMKAKRSSIFGVIRKDPTDGKFYRMGTGFVVKYKNRILGVTAAHVCEADSGQYYFSKGKNTYGPFKWKVSRYTDLCVTHHLTLDRVDTLNLAKKITYNQKVFNIGYPVIRYMTAFEGRLKGFDQFDAEADWISIEKCKNSEMLQVITEPYGNTMIPRTYCKMSFSVRVTTARGGPGQSGAPSLDEKGDVVGMVSGYNPILQMTFIIPLKNLIKELEEYRD